MHESNSQRDQDHNLEGIRGHDIVLQPKKVSSPNISLWGLGIPEYHQYQDHTFIFKIVIPLFQTLCSRVLSRTSHLLL